MKKAFTLIELLVVIAIIAILAAILFPVFAQAKTAAKKTSDLSNIKQIGTATMLYVDSYDDTLYPHRLNCNDPAAPTLCTEYTENGNLRTDAPDQAGGLGSPVNARYYWVYMLQPYTKNYAMFANPGKGGTAFYPGGKNNVTFQKARGAQAGNNYGGQNSYGHNDVYLSPAANTNGGSSAVPAPPTTTSIPRPSSTIMIVDASYYGAAMDISNASGFTDMSKLNGTEAASTYWTVNGSYPSYWKNIGDSDWTVTNNSDADAVKKGQALYGGKLNVQWADGHAKSLDYKQVVGNICYWTTDVDGAHPNCG